MFSCVNGWESRLEVGIKKHINEHMLTKCTPFLAIQYINSILIILPPVNIPLSNSHLTSSVGAAFWTMTEFLIIFHNFRFTCLWFFIAFLFYFMLQSFSFLFPSLERKK